MRLLTNGLIPFLLLFALMLLIGYVVQKRRARRIAAGEEPQSSLPGLHRPPDDEEQ